MSPDQMLALLPNTVLSGLLYLLVKHAVSRLEADKKKVEEAVEKNTAALIEFDKKFMGAATQQALTNMGERFTAALQASEAESVRRHTALAQDFAVVKDRQERK